jgi:hypothetical protein
LAKANKIISILKLIFAVLLLPVTIAASFGFAKEIVVLGQPLVNFFLWGIFAFLILYHLIWEPAIVYQKGQRVVEVIFSFFAPLVKVASFCLPIYTLLILIAYWLLSLLIEPLKNSVNYFIILASFFLAMHIVFTAKSLKSRQADFLKANYFFALEFIYLINICLTAGLFNIIFNDFSFLQFFRSTCQNTQNIISPVFNQLFVVR